MTDAVATGLGGLVVLILLIVLRMPVAYAMILAGGGGIMLLNGPAPVLSTTPGMARTGAERTPASYNALLDRWSKPA